MDYHAVRKDYTKDRKLRTRSNYQKCRSERTYKLLINENLIPRSQERIADKPACVDGVRASIPKSILSFLTSKKRSRPIFVPFHYAVYA